MVLLVVTGSGRRGTEPSARSGVATQVELERDVLRVSPTARYLTYTDGTPFFWLADSAWGLSGLSQDEVELYFADRRSKGFNVIQINVLVYLWAERGWNAGLPAFQDNNTDLRNEAFWAQMDWIVDRAKAYGLHMALTLGWGYDYPTLFGNDTAKATRFGRWVGARYRDRSNIISIVAGEYDQNLNRTTWSAYDAVAQGLLESDSNHLITIHPATPTNTQDGIQSSSVDWHARPWLSFNILQSGHVDDRRSAGWLENYQMVENDNRLVPTKPVLDAEPAYEDTPDGIFLGWNSAYRIGADVVRRKAYWSVFAGAAGHTYGHNDIYRFWKPGDASVTFSRTGWVKSLQAPGAGQMKHLKALMESRSFDRVSDQTLLASDPDTGRNHVRASLAASRRDAVVYTPTGNAISVRMDRLAGFVRATWFESQGRDEHVDRCLYQHRFEDVRPARESGSGKRLGARVGSRVSGMTVTGRAHRGSGGSRIVRRGSRWLRARAYRTSVADTA